MGVDIHMNIVKDNKTIAEEIFDGRNSTWFNQLNHQKDEYEFLHMKYGISPQAPKEFDEDKLKKDGYYGFKYFTVKDYLSWFKRTRPDTHAGWLTTYEKWLYEKKGITPDVGDLRHTIYKDEVISEEDLHFVTIVDEYDCSRWLYRYLIDNKINKKAHVTFWFDC